MTSAAAADAAGAAPPTTLLAMMSSMLLLAFALPRAGLVYSVSISAQLPAARVPLFTSLYSFLRATSTTIWNFSHIPAGQEDTFSDNALTSVYFGCISGKVYCQLPH